MASSSTPGRIDELGRYVSTSLRIFRSVARECRLVGEVRRHSSVCHSASLSSESHTRPSSHEIDHALKLSSSRWDLYRQRARAEAFLIIRRSA